MGMMALALPPAPAAASSHALFRAASSSLARSSRQNTLTTFCPLTISST